MEDKQTKKINYKKIYLALIILMLIFSCLLSTPTYFKTYAEDETTYTSVLEDLEKDENFDINKYPLIENNPSLEVIQIAESSDKELFVYVYQPGGESLGLQATSINISTEEEALFFINYDLSLIHSNSVFYKYKVENLIVSDSVERVYNISSIFRSWDERFDEPVDDDQTISEVSYGVSQIWTAKTENDNVIYEREDTQTIKIESKYVGFIRYTSSYAYWLTGTACDSHFVAFSTDHEIDDLYSADISYVRYTYKRTYDTGILGGGDITSDPYKYEYGEDVPVSDTLIGKKVEIEVGLGITTKFEWNRIESVNEFLNEDYISENLKESAKNSIREKDWVLRFYESDYKIWADSIGSVVITEYESGERVKDVTILRLKFQTNGEVYNLGVVDNIQTGSDEPSNDMPESLWERILKMIATIIAIVLIVVAVVVLAPIILPAIFKFLGFCFKWLFKGIWWLITAPFSIFND